MLAAGRSISSPTLPGFRDRCWTGGRRFGKKWPDEVSSPKRPRLGFAPKAPRTVSSADLWQGLCGTRPDLTTPSEGRKTPKILACAMFAKILLSRSARGASPFAERISCSADLTVHVGVGHRSCGCIRTVAIVAATDCARTYRAPVSSRSHIPFKARRTPQSAPNAPSRLAM
jgi:hypothetical protein